MVFDAVDRQYPDFRNRILTLHSGFDIKELIFIYLMKLGFRKADISRITKSSKSSVSRRFQQIEDKLGVPIENIITD